MVESEPHDSKHTLEHNNPTYTVESGGEVAVLNRKTFPFQTFPNDDPNGSDFVSFEGFPLDATALFGDLPDLGNTLQFEGVDGPDNSGVHTITYDLPRPYDKVWVQAVPFGNTRSPLTELDTGTQAVSTDGQGDIDQVTVTADSQVSDEIDLELNGFIAYNR